MTFSESRHRRYHSNYPANYYPNCSDHSNYPANYYPNCSDHSNYPANTTITSRNSANATTGKGILDGNG